MSDAAINIFKGEYEGFEYEYTIESDFSSRRVPRFMWKGYFLYFTKKPDSAKKIADIDIRMIEGKSESEVKNRLEYKIKEWIGKKISP